MATLATIVLVIIGIILLIGIIRTIFDPPNSLGDFLFQLMLLDWMGDCLSWVLENISDLWDDD